MIVSDMKYFDWLCERVRSDEINNEGLGYRLLLRRLFDTPFRWFIPNDDNRLKDGLALRDEFIEEERALGLDVHIENSCSVLEVMISIAERCSSMIPESEEGSNPHMMFWEMLDNLGLLGYVDEMLEDHMYVREVDYILKRLLDRTYTKSGRGGLFPLKNPKKDQTKVEIWYQMSAYLLENYYESYVY